MSSPCFGSSHKTLGQCCTSLLSAQRCISKSPRRLPCPHTQRTFISSPPITQEISTNLSTQPHQPPRWRATPVRMKAPFRSKPAVYGNDFPCNEDPDKLDRAYIKTLGNRGDELLAEDVKWLAVTHKSFDHGRRGFNDRLAYLGVSPEFPSSGL